MLAARSGQDHLESLRDGRDVSINGERVADVTIHQAFRPRRLLQQRPGLDLSEAHDRDQAAAARDYYRYAGDNDLLQTRVAGSRAARQTSPETYLPPITA
jgi:hypothetical protein